MEMEGEQEKVTKRKTHCRTRVGTKTTKERKKEDKKKREREGEREREREGEREREREGER